MITRLFGRGTGMVGTEVEWERVGLTLRHRSRFYDDDSGHPPGEWSAWSESLVPATKFTIPPPIDKYLYRDWAVLKKSPDAFEVLRGPRGGIYCVRFLIDGGGLPYTWSISWDGARKEIITHEHEWFGAPAKTTAVTENVVLC